MYTTYIYIYIYSIYIYIVYTVYIYIALLLVQGLGCSTHLRASHEKLRTRSREAAALPRLFAETPIQGAAS